VLLGAAVVVFAIDQLTKAWIVAHLSLGETLTPIPAIGQYLALTRSLNTGAAFSILPQAGDLFLLIALAMIIGIIILYPRMAEGHWLERVAYGLLLGGVAGNAVDRIRLGYVVDFVLLQVKPLISNVSNLADHAIVIGILLLFVSQWQSERAKKQPQLPSPNDG
jgi:signal peptidase II